jgi:hypothetical protein
MSEKKFLDRKECQQFAVDFIRLAPRHHGILAFQMMDTRFNKTTMVDMLKTFRNSNPDLFVSEFGTILTHRLDAIEYKSVDEICRFGDDLNCKVKE